MVVMEAGSHKLSDNDGVTAFLIASIGSNQHHQRGLTQANKSIRVVIGPMCHYFQYQAYSGG
jgi:hypothetical protein